MNKVVTFTSGLKRITADWYEPTVKDYPVAVVAYGTEGMNAPFDKMLGDYCEALLNAGIAVIRPDFFSSTDTSPGMLGVFGGGSPGRFDVWVDAIKDAAKYALDIPDANGKLVFVGFSLGANLSLRAASEFTPKSIAVIDFFGPIGSIALSRISPAIAKTLPPVQIHHGNEDGIVKFSESIELDSWLKAESIECEFDQLAYSGSGHPGQKRARELMPQLPDADWSASDQKKSISSSLLFLKNHL